MRQASPNQPVDPSEPLSILFVIPSFRVGGAERVLVRIANALAADGQRVTVAAIENAGTLASQLDQRIVIEQLNVGRTIYAFPAIIRLVHRLRPRSVFSTLTRTNVLVLLCKAAFPAQTRLVIRQPVSASWETHTPRIGWIYAYLIRRLYRTADLVISQSGAMSKDLVDEFGVPPDRLITIGNPAPEVDILAERQRHSPFRTGLNYLAVGRLVPEKGYETLIRAFADVLVRRRDARLTILGIGPMEAELRSLIANLGLRDHVDLPGLIADPIPYYVHADVVVLASFREGFPNCLIESLACGTPVVATDCSGAAVEIIEPGINGLIVDAGDIGQLRDAMQEALVLRERVGRDAIARTAMKFAPEVVLRKYVELLTGRRRG